MFEWICWSWSRTPQPPNQRTRPKRQDARVHMFHLFVRAAASGRKAQEVNIITPTARMNLPRRAAPQIVGPQFAGKYFVFDGRNLIFHLKHNRSFAEGWVIRRCNPLLWFVPQRSIIERLEAEIVFTADRAFKYFTYSGTQKKVRFTTDRIYPQYSAGLGNGTCVQK